MTLLNDILKWATASLTAWQRDAMRRLFQKEVLDQQDLDDLYAMLKSAHGVSDPENREPDPLSQKYLPAQTANAAPVILRSMRDLKHVNSGFWFVHLTCEVLYKQVYYKDDRMR